MAQFPINPVSELGYPVVHEVRQITSSTTGAAVAAIAQPTAGTKPDANSRGGEPRSVSQIVIQADPGNSTDNILIGTDSGSAKFALAAGASITLNLSDPTQLYIKASANTPKANLIFLGS